MALRPLTLHRLVLWIGCGLLAVFFTPLAVYALWEFPRAQEAALEEKAVWFARRFAGALVEPLLARDRFAARRILARLVAPEGPCRYALVLDEQARPVAHTFEGAVPAGLLAFIRQPEPRIRRFRTGEGLYLDVTHPLLKGLLGHLHLGWSRDEVVAVQRRTVWFALAILASAFAVLLAGTWAVARLVSRPLRTLDEDMRRSLPGGSSSREGGDVTGTVEVRSIAARFQDLLGRLEALEQIVPSSYRQRISEGKVEALDRFMASSGGGREAEEKDAWSDAYLEDRYAWFVFHRWIAIGGILLAWLFYLALSGRPQAQEPTLAVILALAAWNCFLEFRKHRAGRSFFRPVRIWLMAQVVVDLLSLTTLLHLHGGMENPFRILYVFLVVITALIFPLRASLTVAVLSTLLYGGTVFAEMYGTLPHAPLLEAGTVQGGGLWRHPAFVFGDTAGMCLVQVGLVFFIHGVTRRRLAAEQARRMAEQVARSRERLALLGELAAGVAHEIRNPIHGMLNCCELLASQNGTNKDTVELTALMEEGLRRVNNICERLLRIGRPSTEHMERIAVGELVESTAELVRETARRKGVMLQLDLHRHVPPVQGDSDRLSEAILNLLTNSLDACEGGGRIVVEVDEVQQPERDVKIVVRDTGRGIPPEVLPKIFKPFFSTKGAGEGTGLGLSLVEETIRAHGGSVAVRSKPGYGTEVTILLPAAGISEYEPLETGE